MPTQLLPAPPGARKRRVQYVSGDEKKWRRSFAPVERRRTANLLIEYGLLLVLVALLSITFVTAIGTSLSKIFSNANTALTGASGG